jgi:hypothetical protein
MMTDREKIVEMFERAEIEYSTYDDGTIEIEHGHAGFYVEVHFNEDDSLKEMGAWE